LTENFRGYISDFDNEILAGVRMKQDKPDQDLYGGLIRLHILHHAAARPGSGLWFIEELARHGYKLSPGTLYPVLHGLERKGYLQSVMERCRKRRRPRYS